MRNKSKVSKPQNKVPLTKSKRRVFRKKEKIAMTLNNKKISNTVLKQVMEQKKLYNKQKPTVTQKTDKSLDIFLRDFYTYSQNYRNIQNDETDINDYKKFKEIYSHKLLELCKLVKSQQLDLDSLIKTLQEYVDDDTVVKELQLIYFCCWLLTDYLGGYQSGCDESKKAKHARTISGLIEQLNSLLPSFYACHSKAKLANVDSLSDLFMSSIDGLTDCFNVAIDVRYLLTQLLNSPGIQPFIENEKSLLKETCLILDFICYFGIGFIKKYFNPSNVPVLMTVENVFKKYQSNFSNNDRNLNWSLSRYVETKNKSSSSMPSDMAQLVSGHVDKNDSGSSISSHGNDAYFEDFPSGDEFNDENKLPNSNSNEDDNKNESATNRDRRSLNRSCRKVIDYSYKEDLRRIVRVSMSPPNKYQSKRNSFHSSDDNLRTEVSKKRRSNKGETSKTNNNEEPKNEKKQTAHKGDLYHNKCQRNSINTGDENATFETSTKRQTKNDTQKNSDNKKQRKEGKILIGSKIQKNGKKKQEKEKHLEVRFFSQSLVEQSVQRDKEVVGRFNSLQVQPKRKLYSPTEWMNSSYIKKLEKSIENEK